MTTYCKCGYPATPCDKRKHDFGHECIAGEVRAPYCPRCGVEAVATKTRYGIRHDCCGLWSWGGAPLADSETHDARKVAHDAFDKVWKDGHTKRETAYAMLAKRLNVPLAQCHIKLMSTDQCAVIPKIAKQLITYLTGVPA